MRSMTTRTRWILGAALTLALAAGGAATAASSGDGTPITGPALQKASAAALAHTGGGRVTDTETDDDEGPYEVEVTLANGRQVEVHLDRDFKIINRDDDHGEAD